jgi:hypothetical protein
MSGRSRRRTNINGPFIAHPLEMRRSPAWAQLSDNARRLLDRLEVEHMEHGGSENGSLICTYDDFEKSGIRRPSVPRSLRECVLLGFVEVTTQGGLAVSDRRFPSRYRLTYVQGRGKSPNPTHDWQKLDDEQARTAVARAAIAPPCGGSKRKGSAASRRHPTRDIDSSNVFVPGPGDTFSSLGTPNPGDTKTSPVPETKTSLPKKFLATKSEHSHG